VPHTYRTITVHNSATYLQNNNSTYQCHIPTEQLQYIPVPHTYRKVTVQYQCHIPTEQ